MTWTCSANILVDSSENRRVCLFYFSLYSRSNPCDAVHVRRLPSGFPDVRSGERHLRPPPLLHSDWLPLAALYVPRRSYSSHHHDLRYLRNYELIAKDPAAQVCNGLHHVLPLWLPHLPHADQLRRLGHGHHDLHHDPHHQALSHGFLLPRWCLR